MIDEEGLHSTPPTPGATVSAGDTAAKRGDWVRAVAIWERLLDTPQRPAASKRIRWFLDEAGDGKVSRARFSRGRMLAAVAVLAILGTACVFIGQVQSGSVLNVLSAISWAFYIASAVVVVAYAFTGGEPRRPISEVTRADVPRARTLAERLASNDRRDDREA